MIMTVIRHLLTWTHLKCPTSVAFNLGFALEWFGEFFLNTDGRDPSSTHCRISRIEGQFVLGPSFDFNVQVRPSTDAPDAGPPARTSWHCLLEKTPWHPADVFHFEDPCLGKGQAELRKPSYAPQPLLRTDSPWCKRIFSFWALGLSNLSRDTKAK